MAQGPRKGKMKASPKAKTIASAPSDLKKITLPDGTTRWVEKQDPDRHRNIKGLHIRKA